MSIRKNKLPFIIYILKHIVFIYIYLLFINYFWERVFVNLTILKLPINPTVLCFLNDGNKGVCLNTQLSIFFFFYTIIYHIIRYIFLFNL